jgi:hypothetical protein
MTRAEIAKLLRSFIREWRIDPHDAGEIYGEIPAEGLDRETLGDWLDGAGYPELASAVYEGAAA